METPQNTAAAQEPAGSNHATTTNPTEKEGDKSAKKDMFGDWLVVPKSKKPTKSRYKIEGADKGLNKETTREESVQRNRNRYAALYEKVPVSNGKQVFQEGTKVNHGDCQLSDANYEKVMERLGDVFKRGGEGLNVSQTGQPSKVSTATGPTTPLEHAHGIKTSMHVEGISPNHLCFVDEPRPPDPTAVQSKLENEELPEGGMSPMQEVWGITLWLWKMLGGTLVVSGLWLQMGLAFHFKCLIVARKSILKARDLLLQGFRLKVGNGDASFWFDDWSGSGPLCSKVFAVDIHDLNIRVKDVWMYEDWQWGKLWTFLNEDIISFLSNQRLLMCEEESFVIMESLAFLHVKFVVKNMSPFGIAFGVVTRLWRFGVD
ncbi:putative ribonuclease H protein [Sesbania bispinosa]|nr:putative ribonuclease H protein [Sesbania bispinosa]